jgi:hypothetical protein
MLALGALLVALGCGGGGATPEDPGTDPGGGVPPDVPPYPGTDVLVVNEVAADGQRYRLTLDFQALDWRREGRAGAAAGLVRTGRLHRRMEHGWNAWRLDDTSDLLVLPGVFAATRDPAGLLTAGVLHTERMPTPIDLDGVYSYVRWGSLGASHGALHWNADGTYHLWHARLDYDVPDESGTWKTGDDGVFEAFPAGGESDLPAIELAAYPSGVDSILVLRDVREPALLLAMRRRIIPGTSGLFTVLDAELDEPYELDLAPPTFRTPWGERPYYYNVPWNGFASWLSGDDVDRVLVSRSGLLFASGREGGAPTFWISVRR